MNLIEITGFAAGEAVWRVASNHYHSAPLAAAERVEATAVVKGRFFLGSAPADLGRSSSGPMAAPLRRPLLPSWGAVMPTEAGAVWSGSPPARDYVLYFWPEPAADPARPAPKEFTVARNATLDAELEAALKQEIFGGDQKLPGGEEKLADYDQVGAEDRAAKVASPPQTPDPEALDEDTDAALQADAEPPPLSPDPVKHMIPEEIRKLMEDGESLSNAKRRLTELLWVEQAELRNLRGTDRGDLKREAEIERLLGLFARLGEI